MTNKIQPRSLLTYQIALLCEHMAKLDQADVAQPHPEERPLTEKITELLKTRAPFNDTLQQPPPEPASLSPQGATPPQDPPGDNP